MAENTIQMTNIPDRHLKIQWCSAQIYKMSPSRQYIFELHCYTDKDESQQFGSKVSGKIWQCHICIVVIK